MVGTKPPKPPKTHEVKLEPRDVHINYPELSLSTKDEPATPVTAHSKHVLVIGAGVSGLMAAWMLLDKGYRVTVLADDWAWNNDFSKSRITSQIAGALWEFPPGGCGLTEIESPGPGWSSIEHYREWALQSYEFYEKYHDKVSNYYEATGRSFGLKFTDLHQFFYSDIVGDKEDGSFAGKEPPYDNEEYLKLQAIQWAAGEGRMAEPDLYHKAKMEQEFKDIIKPTFQGQQLKSAYSHRTPIVNTDKAMAYLMALVKAKGANMETRKFDRPIKDIGDELLRDFSAHGIVNATGLAARELAADEDVYPVRGAVQRVENTRRGHFRHLNDAYLVPAQKDTNKHPTKTVFIVPRNDDVLYVGSIIQPNHHDKVLSQDSPEVQVMWDRAGEFMPTLRHAGFFPGYPFAQGLRPFTKRNVKVRADEGTKFPLVHNYGHGGSGWTLGIGTARCAVYLLEELLKVPSKERLGPTAEPLRVNVHTFSNVATDLQNNFKALDKMEHDFSDEKFVRFIQTIKNRIVLAKKVADHVSESAKTLKKKAEKHKLEHVEQLVGKIDGALSPAGKSPIADVLKKILDKLPKPPKSNPQADDDGPVKTAIGRAEVVENILIHIVEEVQEYDNRCRSEDGDWIHRRAKEVNEEAYGARQERGPQGQIRISGGLQN